MSLGGVALIAHDVRPEPSGTSVVESVKIGLRFLFRQPVLLPAMTLDLFSVLFGGATALLPIFAERMHTGPQGLGLLRAAPAAGSIVVGLWVAHRPPMRRGGRTLFACVAIFGLCMIAFALSRSFWLSLSLLGLSGAADQVSVIIRGTLDSIPDTRFTLQFFANSACDPSGFGEGQSLIGQATATTDAAGMAAIRFTTPSLAAP